ncbi:antitoxin Xre-like helix-turn-helix domain-containing protein [Hydrogenophaga sp. OTU3427]|uniref:antitoxin Xre-like helix-turn-helix domain-containing protein n=1 Tax=Hydrogenophaga sp. OTU3427 TaxID=3043856 RepID=UPI00313DA0BF
MLTTLSSFSSSVDTATRSQAFNALLGLIVSGCFEHPKGANKPNMTGQIDQADWRKTPIPFPSATAYEIVRRGVPSRALIALGDYLGIGNGTMADLVGLNRSVARRKAASDQVLPIHAAESVLRLLELQCLAEDTFDTLDATFAWLRCGHPILDGEAPLERAKSAYGSEQVKEILVSLKYGGIV